MEKEFLKFGLHLTAIKLSLVEFCARQSVSVSAAAGAVLLPPGGGATRHWRRLLGVAPGNQNPAADAGLKVTVSFGLLYWQLSRLFYGCRW